MLVRRDCFARTELHKTKVSNEGTCLWCGRTSRMYRYVIQTDSGRTIDDKTPLSGIGKSGPFCSVRCYQDFNT